jgi:hypothetical protein
MTGCGQSGFITRLSGVGRGSVGSAERAAGDAGEMPVERLAGVGRERGERDHSGDDDVAQFGLNVFPGVGDALARVLAERPDNGLGDFAGFLGQLHDAYQLLDFRSECAAAVQPFDDFVDGAPRVIHVPSIPRHRRRRLQRQQRRPTPRLSRYPGAP